MSNHMSIRSRLVSHPNEKLILNSGQLFNATVLSPKTFGVILPLHPRGKYSIKSQINPGTTNENNNSKVRTIKIKLDTYQLYAETSYTNVTELSKIKRINGQYWQGP